MTDTRRLTVVTRRECELCTDLLALLHPMLETGRVSIEERDVDSDPMLHALYCFRVPVVLEGERELLWGRIEPEEFATVFGSMPGSRPNP